MHIDDTWAPLLLHAVNDAIRYREMLLQSETLRDIEDEEEGLIHLGQLLGELRKEYEKNEHKYKFSAAEILGEAPPKR